MSAPDHTPYLLPTDLRTAEDVAEWLRERAERALHATTPPSVLALHYAHADLAARLDRERRLACERGAEYCERRAEICRKCVSMSVCPSDLAWGAAKGSEYDALALAFRAAARQP